MSTPEEKRELRRREILQSAKEVFAERGYHAASISEIIKSAGIARGTFYLYFQSKDAVFESILELAMEELNSRIIGVDISAGAPPPSLQLHENVSRVLTYMLGDKPLMQLILNHGLPPEADVASRVESFFDYVEELIATSLTLGMTMGLVRQCDAKLSAAQILGALRGGMRHLMRRDQVLRVDEAAAALIEFSLKGVIAVRD